MAEETMARVLKVTRETIFLACAFTAAPALKNIVTCYNNGISS